MASTTIPGTGTSAFTNHINGLPPKEQQEIVEGLACKHKPSHTAAIGKSLLTGGLLLAAASYCQNTTIQEFACKYRISTLLAGTIATGFLHYPDNANAIASGIGSAIQTTRNTIVSTAVSIYTTSAAIASGIKTAVVTGYNVTAATAKGIQTTAQAIYNNPKLSAAIISTIGLTGTAIYYRQALQDSWNNIPPFPGISTSRTDTSSSDTTESTETEISGQKTLFELAQQAISKSPHFN